MGYPPQTSHWGGRPAQKKSMLPTIILIVFVLIVVLPMMSSFFSSLNEVQERPTYTPPTYTPPNPSSESGKYQPGLPDLNPPEAPMPDTWDDVRAALLNNPLFLEAMPPTDCQIDNVDLEFGAQAAIEQHMNDFVGCLMKAWYPPVTNAGYLLPRPSVTVYNSAVTTRCGELPMYNAVYCSADQQVYYAKNLIEAFPPAIRPMRFLAESIIAHEFGHAVQYRTMILYSEMVLEYEAEDEDTRMSASRRLEMQADCFTGLFLNSVAESTDLTQSDRHNIEAIFSSLGGSTPYADDHGLGSNRAWWTNQGLASTLPSVCNTFTAEEDQVG